MWFYVTGSRSDMPQYYNRCGNRRPAPTCAEDIDKATLAIVRFAKRATLVATWSFARARAWLRRRGEQNARFLS
jgi:hypothetical protein